jgi:hypothetical protein
MTFGDPYGVIDKASAVRLKKDLELGADPFYDATQVNQTAI